MTILALSWNICRHCEDRSLLTKPVLLTDMHLRHFGLSEGVAMAYMEAIRVCLDRHHTSPQPLDINDRAASTVAEINWDPATPQIRAAWNNRDDATRDGAYGLAIAVMEATRGLVAVGRAETKTGADYYLATPDKEISDLESAIRLEVSGIDSGTEAKVRYRLELKLRQATRGDSNLPAIACIVEFSTPRTVSSDV